MSLELRALNKAWRTVLIICFFAVLVGWGLQHRVFAQAGTSFANAAVISAGTYTYIIPASANHFFKFEAARGQSVAITLTMQNSDLNLYLYNDAQAVVASSAQANVGFKEEIRYLVKLSGYYFIRVENRLPIQDTYTLTFSPIAPGATIQDALTILEGTYNYTIDSRGEHYYKISGRVGQILTATVAPTKQLDLTLTLYSPDRVMLASSNRVGLGGSEALQSIVDVEGEYYLKVSNLLDNVGFYSLTVNLVRFDVAYVRWGSITSPLEVDAGEVAAPLTVGVRASAEFTLSSFEGELHLRAPFSDPLGRSTLTSSFNYTIPSFGGLVLFNYNLNILEGAQKGFYTLPLTIRYYANQPDGVVYRNPVNLTIQIPITGKARVEVSADVGGLDADSVNVVRFTFRNAGSADISALKATVATTPPLIIVGGEAEWELGLLKAGEVKSVKVSIYAPPSSAGGTYQITLTTSYRNSVGNSMREGKSVFFYVNTVREAELDVVASKQMLAAGKANTLHLTVRNNDARTLYSVRLSLSLTPPLRLEGKDNVWQIGDLASGEARSIVVNIFAAREAVGQTFQITATITYKPSPNIQMTSVRTIAASVKEVKAPHIVVEGVETDLTAGGWSPVKIVVLNNSTTTIKSIEAFLTLPPPLTASTDRWRLNAIFPSDAANIHLEVYTPASAAASTFNSKLTLTYYDEDDVEFTETYSLGLVASKIAAEPLLTLKVGDNTLTSGTAKEFSFKVVNQGGSTAYSLEVLASTQPPLTITSGAKQSLGILKSGAEAEFTISAKAPFDSAEGAVPLVFTFTYYVEGGQRRSETLQTTIQLIRSTLRALNVDYTPKEVLAGGAEEIKVMLANLLDGSLSNMELRFTSPSASIQISGVDYITVNKLEAGANITIPLKIYVTKSALGSTGAITLTARLLTPTGDLKTETATLGFQISGSRQSEVKLRLSTEDYDLYAAKVNEVLLRLRNVGEEDANNISVKLHLPPTLSIVGDSGNWYFDKIEAGGEAQIAVKIFTPKSLIEQQMLTETAQATLSVRYVDRLGLEWLEDLTLGLTVRGYIDLRVSGVSVRPELVAPSSTFTVSGIVYNGGIIPAKSVNVSALVAPPFVEYYSYSTILGEIPKDGQSSFSLTLRVGDAPPATYPLQLNVQYMDDRAVVHTKVITIKVNVAKPVSQQIQQQPLLFENYLITIPAAFILGVVLSWLVLRRKRGFVYQNEESGESAS